VLWIGTVVEQARSERTVNAAVELDEKESLLESGRTEPVEIDMGNALDETVHAKFSQIVAQLMESVIGRFDRELIEEGAVEFGRRPSAQLSVGLLEQDFHQAHEAGVLQSMMRCQFVSQIICRRESV